MTFSSVVKFYLYNDDLFRIHVVVVLFCVEHTCSIVCNNYCKYDVT